MFLIETNEFPCYPLMYTFES